MRIESYAGDREPLLPLFRLADDSPIRIADYLGLGGVWVAREGAAILGHAQLIAGAVPGTVELKSLAVIERRQGEGIGRALVEHAVALCRERRAARLTAATAAADIGNLRFYQRCGFRMERIVRNVFMPVNGYPAGAVIDGIPLCDQVVLSMELI